jgi:hypothetical protein
MKVSVGNFTGSGQGLGVGSQGQSIDFPLSGLNTVDLTRAPNPTNDAVLTLIPGPLPLAPDLSIQCRPNLHGQFGPRKRFLEQLHSGLQHFVLHDHVIGVAGHI